MGIASVMGLALDSRVFLQALGTEFELASRGPPSPGLYSWKFFGATAAAAFVVRDAGIGRLENSSLH